MRLGGPQVITYDLRAAESSPMLDGYMAGQTVGRTPTGAGREPGRGGGVQKLPPNPPPPDEDPPSKPPENDEMDDDP
jgi:hypothetical protein